MELGIADNEGVRKYNAKKREQVEAYSDQSRNNDINMSHRKYLFLIYSQVGRNGYAVRKYKQINSLLRKKFEMLCKLT